MKRSTDQRPGVPDQAGNVRHEHKDKVWRDVKRKDPNSGVVSHATDLVEHLELVIDCIITFAEIVGQENVIAGTIAARVTASIRKSPGPPARRRGAREREIVELS
jgi:hypothetical protein